MKQYETTASQALHGGGSPSKHMKNIGKTPAIHQSSVFLFDSLDSVDEFLHGDADTYMYTRLGNPNQRDLAQRLAALDGAQAAAVTSSGMAAIYCAVSLMLNEGGPRQLLVSRRLYGGTKTLVEGEFSKLASKVVYIDYDDMDGIREAMQSAPSLLYFETISNPAMTPAPVTQLLDLAKRYGALSIVDNTFLSPVLLRPLELGADLVIHSSTKYLNGHSDATGGVLCSSTERVKRAEAFISRIGCQLSPFEAWLILRGVQTLDVRMKKHCENALALAEFLESPEAKAMGAGSVQYPLSPSNPRFEENRKLFPLGCGGMLSFDLGSQQQVDAFLKSCEMITFAPSLAGLQTTMTHPATTSHRNQSDEELALQGVTRGSIRLSVGIEHIRDIIDDVRLGLVGAKAFQSGATRV